jgi:hypothetical protein
MWFENSLGASILSPNFHLPLVPSSKQHLGSNGFFINVLSPAQPILFNALDIKQLFGKNNYIVQLNN